MDWNALVNLDPDVIEILKKTKESLVLREPISLDELCSEMEHVRARFPGEFRIKKRLLGTAIVFDKYMKYGTIIKVKEEMVTIKRIDPSSNSQSRKNSSVSHLFEVVDQAKGVIDAITTGEASDDLLGGPNYFKTICLEMRELLQSRM